LQELLPPSVETQSCSIVPPIETKLGYKQTSCNKPPYATFPFLSAAQAHDSAIAEALSAICDLDLGELQAIEPPRGFGRD
jgi:hypothetical protein